MEFALNIVAKSASWKGSRSKGNTGGKNVNYGSQVLRMWKFIKFFPLFWGTFEIFRNKKFVKGHHKVMSPTEKQN